MESRIKVKADNKQIDKLFNECELFSVRCFELIDNNLYNVTLRHPEIDKKMTSRIYTVNGLFKKFKNITN